MYTKIFTINVPRSEDDFHRPKHMRKEPWEHKHRVNIAALCKLISCAAVFIIGVVSIIVYAASIDNSSAAEIDPPEDIIIENTITEEDILPQVEMSAHPAEETSAEISVEEIAPVETEVESVYYNEAIPLSAELQQVTFDACKEHDVPLHIAFGVMEIESSFREDVVSSANCYGLMQLNPLYFPADLSSADNIRTGVEFLSELYEKYNGDWYKALTAYNAGHDTGNRVYANNVMTAAEQYQ